MPANRASGSFRDNERKENYGMEREHKRWKENRMEEVVACSFRIKIHVFFYTS